MNAAPPVPPAPAGLDSVAGAARYGQAALDDLAAVGVDAALDPAPAAALVARLESLRLAMQSADPAGLRRRVGLIGRLLGRDVALESEAGALAARLGVLLHEADRAAEALAAHAAGQANCAGRVEAGCRRLAGLEADARAWLRAAADAVPAPLREALDGRLDHLRTVLATHELAARQLALLQEQSAGLLARYRNIRDVLLPAWRQRRLGEGAADGAQRAADAARVESEIAAEVAAMAGTLGGRRPARAQDQENAA
ncbi:hypothetical protein [Luteimonas huabeiensis]|uniref:hypothetical protein n=1 Tax=Luteimonas huabeiensis TaxID=1244513 RepID=UPI00046373A3|nr:hypothetical protein [Luteimonas huabeiensis]